MQYLRHPKPTWMLPSATCLREPTLGGGGLDSEVPEVPSDPRGSVAAARWLCSAGEPPWELLPPGLGPCWAFHARPLGSRKGRVLRPPSSVPMMIAVASCNLLKALLNVFSRRLNSIRDLLLLLLSFKGGKKKKKGGEKEKSNCSKRGPDVGEGALMLQALGDAFLSHKFISRKA